MGRWGGESPIELGKFEKDADPVSAHPSIGYPEDEEQKSAV